MAVPMDFSLKYCFADLRHLLRGDAVSSSCPPTDTMHKGRSVVYSPGGFPLHLSLHLIYQKLLPDPQEDDPAQPTSVFSHRFLLRLALEQPSDVPCLPPFHIQPISIPNDFAPRPMHLHRLLLGPKQPAVWGFRWSEREPRPLPLAGGELLGPDSPWTGEFRFQLLDEPLHLIARHPPPSEAEWSCLPADMISAVLRELPLADRVSARLVCRTWWRLLDTDSRVWSNVTHLQSIGKEAYREEPYGYSEGRLNQVQDHKLYEALEFLTSRKATIRSLELDQDPSDMYRGLQHLPTELSQRQIKLKAVLYNPSAWRYKYHKDNPSEIDPLYPAEEKAAASLMTLFRSQPSLERVYLECVDIPIPSLLQALPRLRILSLAVYEEQDYIQAFLQAPPQLTSLDGLRMDFFWDEEEVEEQLVADFSSIVEGGSRLRRVQDVPVSWAEREVSYAFPLACGCALGWNNPMVWGSESLSPAAAAFLLMPTHIPFGSLFPACQIKHHCI